MADSPKRQARRKIPEATVSRLPIYLRSLLEAAGDGLPTISSERLAELSGFNAAKVRKDLSYLGSYGTRGVGYDVEYLQFQMSRELGLTKDWHVVIAGLGNLSRPRQLRRVLERGFPVAALAPTPRSWAPRSVRHVDEPPAIVAEEDIAIGIIARRPGGPESPTVHRRQPVDLKARRRSGPCRPTLRSIWPSSCRSQLLPQRRSGDGDGPPRPRPRARLGG